MFLAPAPELVRPKNESRRNVRRGLSGLLAGEAPRRQWRLSMFSSVSLPTTLGGQQRGPLVHAMKGSCSKHARLGAKIGLERLQALGGGRSGHLRVVGEHQPDSSSVGHNLRAAWSPVQPWSEEMGRKPVCTSVAAAPAWFPVDDVRTDKLVEDSFAALALTDR